MTGVTNIGSGALAQLVGKARDAAAAGGVGAMSRGEALAVALILNRPDWLAAMDYTIAEAIEHIGPEWARLIPAAAQQFVRDRQEEAYASAEAARHAKIAEIQTQHLAGEELDFAATLLTSSDAPGYRDVRFTFDLEPIVDGPRPTIRASISVRPANVEQIARHIVGVHRFAWDRSGSGRPIDATPDEQRPRWIDQP